ncbi:hypothetical protein SSAG_06409 [Streptomyces sp. Mg1]|nr:hypothetical protein SSAG_06409 [Streptomyces sp. Mg1]
MWNLASRHSRAGTCGLHRRRPARTNSARRASRRARRIALALFYARIAEALLFCAGIVAWLIQGD